MSEQSIVYSRSADVAYSWFRATIPNIQNMSQGTVNVFETGTSQRIQNALSVNSASQTIVEQTFDVVPTCES